MLRERESPRGIPCQEDKLMSVSERDKAKKKIEGAIGVFEEHGKLLSFPQLLKIVRNLPVSIVLPVVSLFFSVALIGFTLGKCYYQDNTDPKISLIKQLDNILGGRNWFIYPNDNYWAVGVMRLPKDFKVKSPIKAISTHRGIYGKNETAHGDCGAHLDLEIPLRKGEMPRWQRVAVQKWKDEEKQNKKVFTSKKLDTMFGAKNWRKNNSYSLIVNKLKKELHIEYPITSIDASDSLKYGVGMAPVKAGQGATIWIQGNIDK